MTYRKLKVPKFWPKGKYNGRYIGGIEIKVKINLLWWEFLPKASWDYGQPYFHWFCFHLWFAEAFHVSDEMWY